MSPLAGSERSASYLSARLEKKFFITTTLKTKKEEGDFYEVVLIYPIF
jgi:hypothetical protein